MRPSTRIKVGVLVGLPVLLLAMHLLLPGVSRWLGERKTGLRNYESDHFTVYASDVSAAAKNAELAETFATEFVARWGRTRKFALPEARVSIYLFDDHEALTRHGFFMLGHSLENNGGYFSAKERAIALVRGSDVGLRHELTHMLVSVSWPDAEPSPWFNEGFAQWHERGVEGSLPVESARLVAGMMRDGSFVPLRALLSARQAEFASERNDVWYNEAATLVAWLSMRKPEAFERLVEVERAPGRASEAEVAAALAEPLDAIEAGWRDFIAEIGR